jgi:hypothetical protein
MRLSRFAVILAFATFAFADTVTLKSGRVINGTYLGGTARQVRVDTGDRIQTLDVSDITRIEFSSAPAQAEAPPPYAAPAAPAPPAPAPPAPTPSADEDRPVLRRDGGILRPESSSATTRPRTGPLELPAGTSLVVRMIDGVDSEVNRVGQTFAASVDEPVVINGQTAIPRGADVVLKLVDSKESGTFTGRSELTLDLVSVKVDGRPVDLNTQTVSRESDSRGQRTAKVAGGTAAVGAIIGAIAGGGKGAAVGAAAGGAAGAGSQVITKGQRVKIPSETRLTFLLETPVTI